jgi:hypothetical protein
MADGHFVLRFLGLGYVVILEASLRLYLRRACGQRVFGQGGPFFIETSSGLRSIFMLVRRRGERIMM